MNQERKRKKSSAASPTSRHFDGTTFFNTPAAANVRRYSLSFKDVFDRHGGLEAAFVTTYMLDIEWLSRMVRRVPTIVAHAPESNQHGIAPGEFVYPTSSRTLYYYAVRRPFQRALFHPKVMLLRFRDHLRVVVSSANLVEADWCRVGNIIWLQDFALLNGPCEPSSTLLGSQFKQALRAFVRSIDLSTDFLDYYDFAEARVGLIVSIAGTFAASSGLVSKFGHPSMAMLLSSSFFSSSVGATNLGSLTIGCSSIGKFDSDGYIYELLQSFRANGDCRRELNMCQQRRLYFPSLATVALGARLGIEGAGHLVFSRENYNARDFQRVLASVLCDSPAIEESRSLQHTKFFLRTWPSRAASSSTAMSSSLSSSQPIVDSGFLVIGSHNLSKAAWGHVSASSGSLSVSNTEVSVLMPIADAETQVRRVLPHDFNHSTFYNTEPWFIREHLREILEQAR